MMKNFKVWTEAEYISNANLIFNIGSKMTRRENKDFVMDEYNKNVYRFLLLYFNGQQKALDVFPNKHYALHKNLLICGEVGTGKTMMMKIFSEYLKQTRNPMKFMNTSVTEILNHHAINHNFDKYTFNEDKSRNFEGSPYNICINDIGLRTHLHFGTNTQVFIEEILHARNEIFVDNNKFCHITTNLTPSEIKETFYDQYGRLVDRFKTYNLIPLNGESRR